MAARHEDQRSMMPGNGPHHREGTGKAREERWSIGLTFLLVLADEKLIRATSAARPGCVRQHRESHRPLWNMIPYEIYLSGTGLTFIWRGRTAKILIKTYQK